MSDQITNAFVQEFRDVVEFLAQQMDARMRAAVMVEPVNGEKSFFEQIGPTAVRRRTSRHSDSPLVNTPHDRRMVTMTDFEWGDLIDQPDKVRLLIDPANPYAQNAASAFKRQMDQSVIDALVGTSQSGKDGTIGIVLPATSIVAVDYVETGAAVDSNLTVAKLRRAHELLNAAEVPDDERSIYTSASGLSSLLRDAEVTSSDFNTVRALVNGQIDTYLGFNFIRGQLADIDVNKVRDTIAWHRTGIKLGIGEDVMTRIQERADKSFSTYVFLRMSIGAVRMEEVKVIKILTDEDL